MSRYIDLTEFTERIKKHIKPDNLEEKALIEWCKDECIRQGYAMPIADVVEVRHGEWIDKPTGAYSRMQSWCSACGKHSGIGGIESNRHKPYCPNCGAKMDGERK